MAGRRSLYFLRPIRPSQVPTEPPPPLTPETAPDRLLWLDSALSAEARGATALSGVNQYLKKTTPAGLPFGASNNLLFGAWINLAAPHAGSEGRQAILSLSDITGGQRSWHVRVANLPSGSTGGDIGSTMNLFQFVLSNEGSTATNNVFLTFNAFGAAPIPTNTWLLLLCGWDKDEQVMRARVGSTTNAGSAETPVSQVGGAFATTASLRVGAVDSSEQWKFNGRTQNAFVASPPSLGSSDFDALFVLLRNGGAGRSYASLSSAEKTSLGLVSWFGLSESTGVRKDSHGPNDLEPFGGPAPADGLVVAPAGHLAPVRSWTSRVGSGPPAVVEDAVASRPNWHSDGVLVFDGSNDRLSETAGPIIGNRPAFTLLARVRPAALPASNPAVVYTEADAAGNVVNRLAINATGNVVASYRPSGGALASATSAGTLNPGTDYVIGARRDGTSLQVVIDGTPSGPAATIADGSDLNGATARVGGPVEASGLAHFNGRIEEIFAVGQALSDAHIQDLSGAL